MKIGFIGLGKLGLPVALAIEKRGHSVFGWDINDTIRENITKRRIPYKEEEADVALLTSEIRLAEIPEIVEHADIIFIAVQTPHDPKFEGITILDDMSRSDFDYKFLIEAVSCVAEEAEKQKRKVAVAIISTVLPTTIKTYIQPLLNPHVHLAYNPSFIAMGTTMRDFLNPEFVLCGSSGTDLYVTNKLKIFYRTITTAPFVEMNIAEAELTKVAYNTFIGMKIVFANTLMELCYRIGDMDVDVVTDALKMAKRRLISTAYLSAGMGDGGGCLPAGEIVITEIGPQPIETIQAGDRVLAGDGRLHQVVKVWERDYTGEMINLRVEGMPPVRLTSNHRLYVSTDGRHLYPNGKRDTRSAVALKLNPLSEAEADAVHIGDFIPQTLPIGKQVQEPSYATPEYCELAGWYLSEGSLELSARRGRIAFSLHVKEKPIAIRLAWLLEQLSPPKTKGRGVGACATISRHGEKSISVRYGSINLARQLNADFRKGADQKTIPAWVIYGKDEIAMQVMKGLWQGDGHSSVFGMFLSTISRDIAYGAHLLLARFGVSATLREMEPRVGRDGQKHQRAWEVRVRNARDYGRLAELTGLPQPPNKKQKYYERFPVSNYTYRKITQKTSELFEGKVFNLWIDCPQHTFTTNAGFVSNCHPRDNIALSWLARAHGLSHDIFSDIMECREDQAIFLANLIIDNSRNLPIMILGYTFKPETNLTVGSPALLLQNILEKDNGVSVDMWDPFVADSAVSTLYTIAVLTMLPRAFFIGTKHAEFAEYQFARGSVVIDPFRYIPYQEGVEVIRIGS